MKRIKNAKTTEKYIRRVHIRKEAFKFASAHMTVFEDGTKEALHGHNYTVELSLEFHPVEPMPVIPFSVLKKPMTQLCALWDEKVLLAVRSSFFKMTRKSTREVEFTLCKRRYVLPREEVVLLEVENITSEALAEELCRQYRARFPKDFLEKYFRSVQIRVDESPGQGASFTVNFPSPA